MTKHPLIKLIIISQALVLFMLLSGCAGTPPQHIGMYPKKLQDCPDSPNCVSSDEKGDEHHINPISTTHQPATSIALLKSIIKKDPNLLLIKQIDNYLYAQFTSSILGFVDDLEFIVGETKIQVRSASRLGYSDFGANRKHIEAVRRQFK